MSDTAAKLFHANAATIERLERKIFDQKQEIERLRYAALGLLTRQDFWDSVKEVQIGIPGEFDDLEDAVFEKRTFKNGERK